MEGRLLRFVRPLLSDRFSGACEHRLQAAESLISHDEPFSADEKAKSREIKKSINLNLAAAHLKLKQHSEAIAAASKVRMHTMALTTHEWHWMLNSR